MKVKLFEIQQKPVFISAMGDEPWVKKVFAGLGISYRESPFEFRVSLRKIGLNIFVQGFLKMTIKQPCSRCAQEFDDALRGDFEPVISLEQKKFPDKLEISKEDLEVTYFKGEEIDVAEILHEQVLLLIPFKPLCRSDCKGVCPHCGVDLNVKSCQCNEQEQFNILAQALKEAKVKKVRKDKK